eukprot:6203820-Pleurochrysis_carterae.AAC.2
MEKEVKVRGRLRAEGWKRADAPRSRRCAEGRGSSESQRALVLLGEAVRSTSKAKEVGGNWARAGLA